LGYLVLEDNLLVEFYKFQYNLSPTQSVIIKLLNFYKKHLTNVAQIKRIQNHLNIDFQRLISQLANKRLINEDLIQLSKKTKLKIILSLNDSNFPFVNINGDVFENNFTATYMSGDKTKILEHIKALTEDSNKVEIYDKYLFFDNAKNNKNIKSHYSVLFLNHILSISSNIKIQCYDKKQNNKDETNRIKQRIAKFSNISFDHQNLNEHDRYIKIYKNNTLKYEIILKNNKRIKKCHHFI